jgi:hypothetical protein
MDFDRKNHKEYRDIIKNIKTGVINSDYVWDYILVANRFWDFAIKSSLFKRGFR